MDVGGAGLDRLAQDGVDQADDRCIVFLLQQIAGFGGEFGQAGQVEFGAKPLGHLPHFGGVALVGQGQFLLEGFRLQPVQRQHAAGEALGFLHGGQAGTTTHLQLGLAERLAQQHAMAFGEGERQRAQRRLCRGR